MTSLKQTDTLPPQSATRPHSEAHSVAYNSRGWALQYDWPDREEGIFINTYESNKLPAATLLRHQGDHEISIIDRPNIRPNSFEKQPTSEPGISKGLVVGVAFSPAHRVPHPIGKCNPRAAEIIGSGVPHNVLVPGRDGLPSNLLLVVIPLTCEEHKGGYYYALLDRSGSYRTPYSLRRNRVFFFPEFTTRAETAVERRQDAWDESILAYVRTAANVNLVDHSSNHIDFGPDPVQKADSSADSSTGSSDESRDSDYSDFVPHPRTSHPRTNRTAGFNARFSRRTLEDEREPSLKRQRREEYVELEEEPFETKPVRDATPAPKIEKTSPPAKLEEVEPTSIIKIRTSIAPKTSTPDPSFVAFCHIKGDDGENIPFDDTAAANFRAHIKTRYPCIDAIQQLETTCIRWLRDCLEDSKMVRLETSLVLAFLLEGSRKYKQTADQRSCKFAALEVLQTAKLFAPLMKD